MATFERRCVDWALALAEANPRAATGILDAIGAFYLASGHLKEALELSDRKRDHPIPFLRRVAVAFARSGDQSSARAVEAKIKANHHPPLWEVLAEVEVELGSVEDAGEYRDRIEDPDERAESFANTAVRAHDMRSGTDVRYLLEKAVVSALAIPDSEDRLLRLISVCGACGRASLPAVGLYAAGTLEDPPRRAEALAELAYEFSRVERGTGALALANQALLLIFDATPVSGDQTPLIANLVRAFAWSNDEQKVRILLEGLGSDQSVPQLMAEVASIYYQQGLSSAGIILREALRAATVMSIGLNPVARAAIEMNALDVAFDALTVPVEDRWRNQGRIERLIDLACAYADRNDRVNALEVLALLISVARKSDGDRELLVRRAGIACVRLGNAAEGLRMLAEVHEGPEMGDAYWRAETLFLLQEAYRALGREPSAPELEVIRAGIAGVPARA
jgi:hypothetical protein